MSCWPMRVPGPLPGPPGPLRPMALVHGSRPWGGSTPNRRKKKEFISLAQVALYKQHWANKFNIPVKDIKVGYVFLKRGAPPGKSIELFTFSSGPSFLKKANNLVEKMIINVKKGVKLKNYNNCTFCPYKNTEHCSGKGW